MYIFETMYPRCLEQEKIIRLIKQSDPEGFNLLFDHYASALYGVILRLVNDVSVAEGLLSATLTKVISDIETYCPETTSFLIWMMNISRSLAREHILAYSNTADCKNNKDVFDLITNRGLSIQATADLLCIPKNECISLLRVALKKLNPDPH